MKLFQKHARFICVFFWAVLFLVWVSLHFARFSPTQLGLSCLVLELTGFLCPSCGISRMTEALIRFDFAQAFFFHPIYFSAIVFLLGYAVYATFRVFKTGAFFKPGRKFLCCVATFAAALVIFTFVRNL